ncbi:MAG: SDR family NAD(P)-dependent oxidoreductase [Actinobacteria bacterium]|nr:SDR family NAD(P)-dependent oxidoreductase [Actinomycetota bacterium]
MIMRFDEKVVIVTGAGRNLGREYALEFAARGASVVVNDLGVGISDTDGSADAPATNPADDVVDKIRSIGANAVANHDDIASPAGGRAIVNAALDAFGRVDVVVNNAGQVRMAPFEDFPEESIDTLIDTQLRGTLNVSRPAWKWMKDNGGGRIVNVSSGAAFGGVPNGSVYAMAKMGVIGLTRGMASEGAPHGIHVNVVVPYAKTRPGTAFGPIPWSEKLGQWLDPRLVAPLVVFLSHHDCEMNGETISVGAGWAGGVHMELSDGFSDRDATVEDLAANVDRLMSLERSPLTATSSKAVRLLMAGFRP